MDKLSLKTFQKEIWNYYKKHKRDFPWRKTRNPYRIFISEIMLQQTSTGRVEKYYGKFLREFPNIQSLARAPLRDILQMWQGLGYNRRALYLKRAAKMVIRDYGGKLPRKPEELKKLPGVGDATAGAICVYAFNRSFPFIETNIRRVFIHFFFPRKRAVTDAEILWFIEKTLDRKNSREWYYALMDYGAMLGKRNNENPNRRSTRYAKQSRFRGSDRELRGKILKLLVTDGSLILQKIAKRLKEPVSRTHRVLITLQKDGLVTRVGNTYTIIS